jgi:4-amino-4-deoxy-L-arabinose transferase-like glycosyltransferase
MIGKYAILFFGCVLFHVLGTWSVPLIDRDEPRFAEASREMIERADYVVPHFNNQLRLDKPPLAYWAQVVSYRIFGENDFAARFPSAVAAALIALSLVVRGARISDERVGWWSAIIFTLCLQTFIHAKAAVADMWLAFFVTMAHWCGFQLLRDRLTNDAMPALECKLYWCWWLAFYVSLALGFLAKGPIAWVPLLTVGSTVFYAPNSQLRQRFKFARGIVLMLAIVALWGIPGLVQTQGEFFRIGIGRHVISRSFATMEGHGLNSLGGYLLLLPFYFLTVFVSFFPWSVRLPSLIKKLWQNRGRPIDGSYIDKYLFSGAAIIFIIFSLIKTKLPHYTLPAFALIALLVSRHWPEQKTAAFQWIAAVMASLWIAIALILPPLLAQSSPAYALFQKSRAALRPEMEFGAVDYQEPSLVWYFRSCVKGWMTPLKQKDAAEFMDKAGPRFVILPTALVAKAFPNPPADWKTFSTDGFNIAKGKRVALTLVLKPD